jgi:hypothetical protein
MNEAIKCYRDGRSYLCSPGKGGILYWILFVKNEKETQGKANPRYTAEDRDKLIAQYASDIIKPGITLGDLFQKARVTTLVPLEQGVLSTCFYKRMVLVGDAWHKVSISCFHQSAELANTISSSTLLLDRAVMPQSPVPLISQMDLEISSTTRMNPVRRALKNYFSSIDTIGDSLPED